MPRGEQKLQQQRVVGRTSHRVNCSEQIRNEIQRFESVHPCIYAIYDLLDLVADSVLAQQIRDNVVCIEDAFVNSQEWTLSRAVSSLRLGVVGSMNSGKSSLVHRYLTGSFMQEDDSNSGGRFKKEIVIDGESYLLLIRDEGGVPDAQFCQWADAVLIVFSLSNENSFHNIYQLYAKMMHSRTNSTDIPLIMIGTQDTISENTPRVVDERQARDFANDLGFCAYYETCATYGLNIDRVFCDACQKIVQQRASTSVKIINTRTPTPTTSASTDQHPQSPDGATAPVVYDGGRSASTQQESSSSRRQQQQQRIISKAPINANHHLPIHMEPICSTSARSSQQHCRELSSQTRLDDDDHHISRTFISSPMPTTTQQHNGAHTSSSSQQHQIVTTPSSSSQMLNQLDQLSIQPTISTTTPLSTPTIQRKSRRISNIFQKTTTKEHDTKMCNTDASSIDIGPGRAIPIKQGLLYKKSTKTLNKEWKKKFVCLYTNGRLCYHNNLKDYMEKDSHGKEVYLGLVTVKIPGRQRPRTTQRMTSTAEPCANIIDSTIGHSTTPTSDTPFTNNVLLTAYEFIQEGKAGDDSSINTPMGQSTKKQRKGHRRLGSGVRNNANDDDDESCEFCIVSCDQKRWDFAATSIEERDEWIIAIEKQIERSLQAQLSQKQRKPHRAHGDKDEVLALCHLPGNSQCADCSASNPNWASLNWGTLICIECSGIHRNLNTRISPRVRSLELDEWPVEYIAVMQAIGNDMANSLWEYDATSAAQMKPSPNSDREAKELWIKAKYGQKRYLPQMATTDRMLPSQQLIDALLTRNLKALLLVLAHCMDKDVNATLSMEDQRTPLHLACSIGSPEMTQLLLWYNADIRALDHKGCSALWYAKQGGSRQCANILINAGLDADYGIPPQIPQRNNNNSASSTGRLPISSII